MAEDRADSVADDYAERVLRNEERVHALKFLVSETREADRRLIEQRSDSLAQELERRAEALIKLTKDERDADNREHRDALAAYKEYNQHAALLLREIYETLITENYKQSREAIEALEQRSDGAISRLEQMVRQWRDSDREARDLFAGELARHLDVLNHNNERMAAFQTNSVTRELWQAEKDAGIAREGLLRDQIIALDRSLLTMTPIIQSDKAHAEMLTRMDTSIAASAQVLDNKIGVVFEKVADLKSSNDNRAGRSSGYSALYGWALAAVGLLVTTIVAANGLFAK